MYNNKCDPISHYREHCFSPNNSENNRLFKTPPKLNATTQFLNIPQEKFQVNTKQDWYSKGTVNPYDLPAATRPNILYLVPAIFGSAAGFILGFRFFGHSLKTGYSRYIYFINIYALITSLGVGTFIYESRVDKTTVAEVLFPALLLMFFFGTVLNLTYSLYPDTFSGTIGGTPITQFLSFLAMGVANISVGETLDVVPKKPGVQVLLSMTGLFSLFVFSIIISLIS